MDKESKIKETAEHIVEMNKEVEAASHAALDEASMVRARAILHQWIDGAKGVVVNPAFGRVTVIDQHGNPSSIASPDLTFALAAAGILQSG